jgi:acyl transferase domain-containing protein
MDTLHRDVSQRIANLTPKQRAVLALKAGSSKRESNDRPRREPIAIIGMACRFPGAGNPEAFWQLLRNGTDAITEVPSNRWDLREFYDADPAAPGKMSTRWGGFLEQTDAFDRHFFGISQREADCMDPQQRLLAELAYEALEDAGHAPAQLAGSRTGVFIGISNNDYGRLHNDNAAFSDPFAGTGNALCIGANRLSYLFDFQGPSMAIDTACSSSLVGVHLACQSLWNGEALMALAGGVNLILSPALTVNFSKGGFMAPDGRCKPFDARANGYVRGEGGGLLVLKPLSHAVADGDVIHAVIRGTAVNQDGRSNGLTAPSRHAQEACLREAYQRAGIAPSQVQYVEAHGTGTALGDPIEALALGTILGENRPAGRPCHIGSVKSNIGHLEAAAGIASLIKVVLALRHQTIPPTLHYQTPNPHIPFDRLPLRVQQTLGPWPEHDGAALAGVSSFGFGGTNAHVVVESAPVTDKEANRKSNKETLKIFNTFLPCLLPLSARDPEALAALARSYRQMLEGSATNFADIVYTAGTRREHHDHRLGLVVRSSEEAIALLDAFLQEESRPNLALGRRVPGRRSRLAFVFSGQGPQWWGMGRQLLEREEVFRKTMEQCDALLQPLAGWSLLDELRADEAHSRLGRTEIAQPALFAVQVALATLWRSWGIKPDAVVGHSLGEVAAAHVAGVLSLEDAIRVIYHRGRLMQKAAGNGRTAAVELSRAEARRAIAGLEDRVCIAAVNSPTSTTLAGDADAVESVVETLKQRGVPAVLLRVDCAFHSHHVESTRHQLTEALKGLRPQRAQIPLYSTVTGNVSDGVDMTADYWGRNVRHPVLFEDALTKLMEKHHDVFLEVGPHPVLAGPINQCLRQRRHEGIVLHSLRRGEEEQLGMLRSLAALYARGYAVEWRQLTPTGKQVRLPAYPWQRTRCWLSSSQKSECRMQNEIQAVSDPTLAFLSSAMHMQLAQPAGAHLWETKLKVGDFEADGMQSGMSFMQMALAAAETVFSTECCSLGEIDFPMPLVLPENGTLNLQMLLTPINSDEASFAIHARSGDADGWTLHAAGSVRQERQIA